jgi:hypothetical protein
MTITRNIVFCHETEKSHLVKFVSSKKSAWIPKQYLKIVGKKVNNMTGRVVHKVEIPKWIFDKIK